MENQRLRIRLVGREEGGTIDLETLRDTLDALLGCLKACERVVGADKESAIRYRVCSLRMDESHDPICRTK